MRKKTNTDEENIHKEENLHQPTAESALNDALLNRNIQPRESERYNVLTFLGNVRDQVKTFLESRTRQLKGIKWNLCVQMEMQRDGDGQEAVITTPYFRSRTYTLLSSEYLIEHDLHEAIQKIFASLEKYILEGSGWCVKQMLKLEIHTVVYQPVGASAFIPLPRILAKTQVYSIYRIRATNFVYSRLYTGRERTGTC